jgi:hypothetical protein
MPARLVVLLLAALACAQAALVGQPMARVSSRSVPLAARRGIPSMLAPELLDAAMPQNAATTATAVSLPATILVSDIIDTLQGFANSPLILLIPIGAGLAVASVIIFILVKAAG